MRLIDADALIEEYDRVHVGEPGGARKLMMNALTIKPEPQWIPCSERLPDIPDNYPHCGIYRKYFLVSLASGCVKTLGYEFDRDEWQVAGSPVIAWMPLPEPYKEGQDG